MEQGRIKALPPEVIGQIAAGEVVERPAAAIKELVENSIDAHATAVTVDIRDGGITSFRVTDNGSGIQPEDIRMAFARHATSKIRTAQDLYGVQSLGFRGEALASIAAVARVTCVTRAKGQTSGLQAVNEGGEMTDIRDAACPEGTTFTVKDLFYNAPVRKKFLKKPSSEAAAVSELMERLILSRPDVSFRFIMDGKSTYFSAGDGKIENACMSIFGLTTLKMMVPVHGCESGVKLDGLLGIGDAARGNRSHEYFFLNGRAMKSALLSGAAEDACRQLVTIGRFPICALHLTMPFENVDVNVHPNKWEVRFTDEAAVRQAVFDILSDALESGKRDESRIPGVFLPKASDAPRPAPAIVTQRKPDEEKPVAAPNAPGVSPETPVLRPAVIQRRPSTGNVLRETPFALPPHPPAAMPVKSEPKSEPHPDSLLPLPEQVEDARVALTFREKPMRLIGVVFDTYILLEYDDKMLLCDQHAIHERLLFEKLMRETSGIPASQALLTPRAVRLTRSEYTAFLENRDEISKAGFDAEDFGDLTAQLRGVPVILGQPEAERCFLDALDELNESGTLGHQEKIQRIIQMACKHAVKGGEKLPEDSLIELVRRMMTEDVKMTCPHGRPLMIELTRTDLEKRFKRIQN